MNTEAKGKKNNREIYANRLKMFAQQYYALIAILFLIIVLSIASPVFLSVNNLMNVLRQVSMTAIVGAGLAFVMLTGEIDISVGSTVALVNILWVKFMVDMGMSVIPATLICLVITSFIGIINAYLIAKVKVPALIVTFAMMSILRGIVFVVTDAYPIYNLPKSLYPLARGYVFSVIPIPVVIMALVFIIAIFVSVKTKFGRFVYATGGNSEAAYLSGIKVIRIKVYAFIIAQCAAAIAAFILSSRLGAGMPSSGLGWEFEAIIACIMGGISLSGGKGKLVGALLGAIFIGVVVNGMTLLGINSYYQQIAKGVILVSALVFDTVTSRNSIRA